MATLNSKMDDSSVNWMTIDATLQKYESMIASTKKMIADTEQRMEESPSEAAVKDLHLDALRQVYLALWKFLQGAVPKDKQEEIYNSCLAEAAGNPGRSTQRSSTMQKSERAPQSQDVEGACDNHCRHGKVSSHKPAQASFGKDTTDQTV